jgi:mono/diheme cytochrome c family protein
VAVLAAAAALAVAGCHPAPALTAQQTQGKQLYDARCATCHEQNALGLNPAPPNLHKIFKGSTLPSGAPATDAQVQQTILQGKAMMPSFRGRITTDQMSALLAYLHTSEFASQSK